MSLLHRILFRVRPAELAVFLKRFFRVERTIIESDVGVRLWVDPVSHFGNEVIRTGTYEPPLLNLIQALLRPGDTFVDVGANEGFFSLSAAFLVKEGRVLAIEPQSRLIPVIRKNTEINGLRNVVLVHGALSNACGELTIHLSPNVNTGSSSTLIQRGRLTSFSETVPMFSLDSVFESHGVGHVRLMKVDCEGAEGHVFSGALNAVRERRIDFMAVEFHEPITGASVPIEIDKFLRKNQYVLTQLGSGQWVYHRPEVYSELSRLGPLASVLPLERMQKAPEVPSRDSKKAA